MTCYSTLLVNVETRIGACTAERIGIGVYELNHNLGHTQYMAILTPRKLIGNNYLGVCVVAMAQYNNHILVQFSQGTTAADGSFYFSIFTF